MVLPDGTKSDRSRPGQGRLALFAVAALVIVAGFVALGSLSPSDPVAIETTTTTSTTVPDLDPPIDLENFSVDQIATGPPLEWERAASSPTGYPLTVTEREGTFYLFASDYPPWAQEPGGLVTWKSLDGDNWERAGEAVISRELQVINVIASTGGFIAIGSRPGGNHLIIWRSDDGIEWTPTEIPTEAESPYITPRPTAATTFGDRLAIASGYHMDQRTLVTDHLAAAGIDVDLPMMSWDIRYAGEDGVELAVRGPLGIPVLTTSLEELGLTEQEQRWVMRGLDREGQSEVLIVDGTGNRESASIPLNWVTNMVSQPDGSLFASGFGGAELNDGFVSTDGLRWEPVEDADIGRAISWGDRLIGVTNGPGLEVLMSSDGQTWEETGVADMFPSQWDWHPIAMGAGPDGLAMTLEGHNTAGPLAGQAREQQDHEHATLTSDGATLSVDHQRSAYVLEVDGETHTWNTFQPGSAQVPEQLEIDLDNEAVLFRDPETGETLAQFGFDELRRLETGSRSTEFAEVIDHHALAFIADGSGWEIRDLDPITGEDSRVILIEVGSGRLIVVTHDPVFDPTHAPPAGFELWTAPIP